MKFSIIRDALLKADEQALTEWNSNLDGGWHPSPEDRLSFTEHRLQLLAGAFAATLRELIRQEEGRAGNDQTHTSPHIQSDRLLHQPSQAVRAPEMADHGGQLQERKDGNVETDRLRSVIKLKETQ